MNYDAPDERWPAALKSSFESYVRDGGGLVTVHASDNALAGWPAFNEMIGIGGWRNRTEKSGPLWYFKDGKLVSDETPGRAGNHGNRVPFAITVQDANHPITKGLPRVWMHQGDELYNSLRGPGENMTVLATAYSDPANHGSGRDEPMLLTLSFGKGRVFHTVLGHDINALSCVGGAAALAPDALLPPELPLPQAASNRAEAVTLPATIPLRMMFPPLGHPRAGHTGRARRPCRRPK